VAAVYQQRLQGGMHWLCHCRSDDDDITNANIELWHIAFLVFGANANNMVQHAAWRRHLGPIYSGMDATQRNGGRPNRNNHNQPWLQVKKVINLKTVLINASNLMFKH
jgi:hypothetical protein